MISWSWCLFAAFLASTMLPSSNCTLVVLTGQLISLRPTLVGRRRKRLLLVPANIRKYQLVNLESNEDTEPLYDNSEHNDESEAEQDSLEDSDDFDFPPVDDIIHGIFDLNEGNSAQGQQSEPIPVQNTKSSIEKQENTISTPSNQLKDTDLDAERMAKRGQPEAPFYEWMSVDQPQKRTSNEKPAEDLDATDVVFVGLMSPAQFSPHVVLSSPDLDDRTMLITQRKDIIFEFLHPPGMHLGYKAASPVEFSPSTLTTSAIPVAHSASFNVIDEKVDKDHIAPTLPTRSKSDISVYECRGLASTKDVEIANPLFHGTPATK